MAEMRWHGSSLMKSVSRETDEASSIIDDERKKAPQSISLAARYVGRAAFQRSFHWEGIRRPQLRR